MFQKYYLTKLKVIPAGVAIEVNLRNLLCAGDKACSGFETQGRRHRKAKAVAPQKDRYSSKNI